MPMRHICVAPAVARGALKLTEQPGTSKPHKVHQLRLMASLQPQPLPTVATSTATTPKTQPQPQPLPTATAAAATSTAATARTRPSQGELVQRLLDSPSWPRLPQRGDEGSALVDIGANLADSAFDKDLEAVLIRAAAAGVGAIIITGCSVQSSRRARDLADSMSPSPPATCTSRKEGGDEQRGPLQLPQLYFTAGVHPHNSRHCDESTIDELRQLASHPKCVAIGEIGLDFNRNFSPPDVQQLWLGRQLSLAAELRMPVFLHCREAAPQLLEALCWHASEAARWHISEAAAAAVATAAGAAASEPGAAAADVGAAPGDGASMPPPPPATATAAAAAAVAAVSPPGGAGPSSRSGDAAAAASEAAADGFPEEAATVSPAPHAAAAADAGGFSPAAAVDGFSPAAAVVHCFTGTADEAHSFLQLGPHVFLGLSGWLCDDRPERGAAQLRELLPHIPLSRLMIETDAPYLVPRTIKPSKMRPSRNEPALLPLVAEEVARVLQLPLEEVAMHMSQVSAKVFGILPG